MGNTDAKSEVLARTELLLLLWARNCIGGWGTKASAFKAEQSQDSSRTAQLELIQHCAADATRCARCKLQHSGSERQLHSKTAHAFLNPPSRRSQTKTSVGCVGQAHGPENRAVQACAGFEPPLATAKGTTHNVLALNNSELLCATTMSKSTQAFANTNCTHRTAMVGGCEVTPPVGQNLKQLGWADQDCCKTRRWPSANS